MHRSKGLGICEFIKRLSSEFVGKSAPSWLRNHQDISILINTKSGSFERVFTVSRGTIAPKPLKGGA